MSADSGEALAWRRERGHEPGTRIARWCVGRCLRSLGRVEEALAEQQDIHERYAGEEDGYVSEEIGECLVALGRLAEARPHFAKAYDLLAEREAWLLKKEPGRMSRIRRIADGGAP